MVNFSDALMNPLTLAGLAVAEGANLSDALTQGAATSMKIKEQKRIESERQRQQQLAQQLPSLLSNLDVNNANQALAKLTAAGVPFNQAANYINQAQDNARATQSRQQMQEILSSIDDGDQSSNAKRLLMAGVASGNPQLIQAARFQQDMINRQEDVARNKQKRERETKIPGLELIEGTDPDNASINKARESIRMKESLDRSLTRLDKLIEKYGSQAIIPTEAQDKMNAELADIRNAERNLANTGVLNVGEIGFLEESYDAFNPTKIRASLRTSEQLRKNLQDYRNKRSIDFNDNLQSFGYKVKGIEKIKRNNLDNDPLGLF